jgi:hypothetical protein
MRTNRSTGGWPTSHTHVCGFYFLCLHGASCHWLNWTCSVGASALLAAASNLMQLLHLVRVTSDPICNPS